jgi:hypothetical protein
LKATWQRHVIAASGYSELGMFDDAALALEEIEPEDKTRKEVLGARVDLYMAAKKWDMVWTVVHRVSRKPLILLPRRSLLRPEWGLLVEDRLKREREFYAAPVVCFAIRWLI